MDYQRAQEIAKELGFEAMAPLKVSTIEQRDEVRAMCATCNIYGKCWSCPPACGDLDACRSLVQAHTDGIIVQTIGDVEDSLDWEGIMEALSTHNGRIRKALSLFKEEDPDCMVLGAGACTLCEKCTCPDAPCRFPDKRISSMESYGMLVNEVCTRNALPYNYGDEKIAYISCVLF